MNIKNLPLPVQTDLEHRNVSILKDQESTTLLARQYERGTHLRESVHQHPESEICFMPYDSGVMLVEGLAYPFSPGDMFLIPGKTYHQPVFDNPHNQGLVVVYFSVRIADQLPSNWADLRTLIQSAQCHGVQLRQNIQAAKLLLEMRDMLQRDSREFDVVCQGTFLHLLSYFARELKLQNIQLDQKNNLLAKKFLKTVDYIHANLSDDLTLAELSRHAGISRSRFCEQFKACFGTTVTQYIQQLRVEKSKALLCDTSLSITEIAYTCGFNWPSFFNRVFKKDTGVSPSCFRQNHLKPTH